ncbi:hypothetical protein A3H90_04165 [Candidatus Peribacteria bacterium RIFCSPLOWO2_02_FULL_55_36]|nr:MAG: hypothetical protein A2789_03250 [Candidatus Peribacteria bacterium RIFCSPHIGHO2_01_FULL_54_22]OGJ63397.1 MAG: hypothetical protein A3D12_04080 [Candidatus Peribacteria bacterium RIFCSPHIGHO2_02_FULL_55_24]OGJ64979.1 MAG: hypothetical protein A3E47_00620 [Candidatus Peribacteria bacterium RIFCSPHIGHO2_12_FULL_54_10]OGJ70450.1 MAG: hypothetical protein A3H90_04165 [Candidatus Peribacteria bacterium RIFCSPLOWO2_02_FULL_55_36]
MHLLWENAQAPLYAGYESFGQHFWICFKATGGDLLFMFVIYVVLAVMHQDLFWIANRAVYAHSATWIIAVFIGMLLAVSFELWAIHVDHRWAYAGMPIIPLLKIGLTPILQMLIIPPLTLLITKNFSHRKQP